MRIELTVINVILFLVGFFLFHMLKGFFPKYFETKGANQATKEDVGKITEIVENIKKDITFQTEQLKAQLALSNQHRFSFKNAEVQAFIEYNKCLGARISYLTNVSMFGIELGKYDLVYEAIQEINRRQILHEEAESNLLLFYRDEEFRSAKMKLHLSVKEYEKVIRDFIFKLKRILENAEIDVKSNPENELEIRKGLNKNVTDLVQITTTKRTEVYQRIFSGHVEMLEIIHSRLKEIEYSSHHQAKSE